jgi:hypothetical protein
MKKDFIDIPVSPDEFVKNLKTSRDCSRDKKIHHSIEYFVGFVYGKVFEEKDINFIYNEWSRWYSENCNRNHERDFSCSDTISAINHVFLLAGMSISDIQASYQQDEEMLALSYFYY